MKETTFTAETAMIKNEAIRAIANTAINNIADGFWHDGASSTNKYHPAWASGDGGLVRHTKAVVWNVYNMAFVNPCVTERDRDLLVAAAILHDSCKRGVNWESPFTVHEHPLLVPQLMSDEELSDEESAVWNEICSIIATHMGQWTTSKRSKIVLPEPKTTNQILLHMADYLASRREFGLTTVAPAAPVKEEPAPASDKQKNFVQLLMSLGAKKGLDMSSYGMLEIEKISAVQCGVLIKDLKRAVGYEEELVAPEH